MEDPTGAFPLDGWHLVSGYLCLNHVSCGMRFAGFGGLGRAICAYADSEMAAKGSPGEQGLMDGLPIWNSGDFPS